MLRPTKRKAFRAGAAPMAGCAVPSSSTAPPRVAGRAAGRSRRTSARKPKSTEAKFTAVMTGDIEAVRQLGAPIEIVGDVARAMICAPPGHRLLVGDFTGIESVVLAWIAGQPDKVEQWAKFFRTQDPSDHPYYHHRPCRWGFRKRRHATSARSADLAFGYQGRCRRLQEFRPRG